MWEVLLIPDFLQQLTLSVTLRAKDVYGENLIDAKLMQQLNFYEC